VEVDVHDVVVQYTRTNTADEVKSGAPKLRPMRVTDATMLDGPLLGAEDMTGESNVIEGREVPTRVPTVTTPDFHSDWMVCSRHATEVTEVHDAVWHGASKSVADTVKSYAPKSKPPTVMERPPESGAFTSGEEATAASKENSVCTVPAAEATVTCDDRISRLETGADTLHETDVTLDQSIVVQEAPARIPLGVNDSEPKLRPETVSKLPPESGAFLSTEESTGESKEKSVLSVPATAPTVTRGATSNPAPADDAHNSRVAEFQTVVMHTYSCSPAVAVKSRDPKFSPSTVIERPAEGGRFVGSTNDKTAASKLNVDTWVPTNWPTVIRASTSSACCTAARQLADVDEDHRAVEQTAAPNIVDAE
jgi:hypothetical protein